MSRFMLNLGEDVQESEVVPESEYDLRVVNVEQTRTKKDDRDMIKATLTIENPPDEVRFPAPIMEYFVLPNAEDDENIVRLFSLSLKRMMTCFNIPFEADGFDIDDWLDAKGSCLVVLEEVGEGRSKRPVNNLKLPFLSSEDVEEEASRPRRRARA